MKESAREFWYFCHPAMMASMIGGRGVVGGGGTRSTSERVAGLIYLDAGYTYAFYAPACGVDLSQIDGLTPYSVLKLLAEIATDMSRWPPTEKHFTSWLTLAPKNKISGGRLLSSRTQPSANRAAKVLRMTAMSLRRTQTALGAFYRRVAARIDKPQAITATARKLALLIYRALRGELVYHDPGAEAYLGQQRTRTLRRLRQRAATLGFDLIDRETGEVLPAGLS